MRDRYIHTCNDSLLQLNTHDFQKWDNTYIEANTGISECSKRPIDIEMVVSEISNVLFKTLDKLLNRSNGLEYTIGT